MDPYMGPCTALCAGPCMGPCTGPSTGPCAGPCMGPCADPYMGPASVPVWVPIWVPCPITCMGTMGPMVNAMAPNPKSFIWFAPMPCKLVFVFRLCSNQRCVYAKASIKSKTVFKPHPIEAAQDASKYRFLETWGSRNSWG
jgi:hypothetical protein